MLFASKVRPQHFAISSCVEMLNEGRFGLHYTYVASQLENTIRKMSNDYMQNEIDF
jgi:hypothetical protein